MRRQLGHRGQGVGQALAPPSCAGALQAEPGSHALAIRRQYFLSPYTMAEVSLSSHPAERYGHSSALKRHDEAPSEKSE
ncbi:hypothetical protein [Methylobacterium currus]|uniref:hypothetical protein n=1 Tax=Methylobacterium currus TaxID=2051553 RepID=UPI001FD53AD4|nr:hypothetical protein [Methylobacterium currus]